MQVILPPVLEYPEDQLLPLNIVMATYHVMHATTHEFVTMAQGIPFSPLPGELAIRAWVERSSGSRSSCRRSARSLMTSL